MEELIAKISAKIGVEANVVKTAIGHVLAYLHKELPEGPVADFINKMPGAHEAIAEASKAPLPEPAAAEAAPAPAAKPSLFGAVTGKIGDMLGGAQEGFMGLVNKLSHLGLNLGQVKTIASETLAHAKTYVGEDGVQKIVAKIPGLSKFL